MNKSILAVFLIFFSTCVFANYEFNGAEHTYAMLLTSNNSDQIRLISEIIVDDKKVSPGLAHISAELLHQNGIEENLTEDLVAWLIQVLGASRDRNYQSLIQNLSDNTDSEKIRRYAQGALKDLKGKSESNFLPGKIDLDRIHQSLLNEITSHPKHDVINSFSMVKKRERIESIYEKIGYPDRYQVRLDFTTVAGPRVVRMLEAVWEGEVTIQFRKTKKSTNGWTVNRFWESIDVRNVENLRTRIFANDYETLSRTANMMVEETGIPAEVYEMIVHRLKTSTSEEDADLAYGVAKLSAVLSASKNERFVPILEKISKEAKNDRFRIYVTAELFELYGHLNDFESLTKALSHEDSTVVRQAAKRIRNLKNYDKMVLEALVARIEQSINIGDTDSNLVDALALMCRTIGESGNASYRNFLENVQNNAESKKLRKYAESSLKNL